MGIIKRLNEIQQELKAPKNQFNSFGNYKYRSCEDILEAVKPLLGDDMVLILTDNIINEGNKNYVEATAILKCGEEEERAKGYAREAEIQKGMNDAQLTGSSSSYARKYALNGLFCIDDAKDDDSTNTGQKIAQISSQKTVYEPLSPEQRNPVVNNVKKSLDKCGKCGADMILNPNTGKMFCKEKCWLKK